MQLSNFDKDSDELAYDLCLYPTSGEIEELNKVTVTSKIAQSPLETLGDHGRALSKKIDEEIELLWVNQSIGTVVGLATAYCPTGVPVLRTIVDQCKGVSVSDFIGDAIKIPEVKKALTDNNKGSIVLLQNILSYYKEKERLQNEKAEQDENNTIPWFYSSNQYSTEGTVANDVYISDGIYDYDVIQGIRSWNELGIGPMLVKGDKEEYRDLSPEEMKERYQSKNAAVLDGIKNYPGYNFNGESEELRNAVLFMIFGSEAKEQEGYTGEYTSILDIPHATFNDAVSIIDNGIEEASDFKDEVKSLQLWNNYIYKLFE